MILSGIIFTGFGANVTIVPPVVPGGNQITVAGNAITIGGSILTVG